MPIQTVTFPRSDEVFARFVRDTVRTRGQQTTQQALETHIRTVYPRAVVRARESLGGYDVEPVWYVYRDGRAVSEDGTPWWEAAGVAEGVFRDGVFEAANDAMCELHALPPGGMVGRRWDEFATLQAIEEADAIWRGLMEGGWPANGEPIQSTFTLVRADGDLQPVEYRTVSQADGSYRTWYRPLVEAERTD